MAARFGDRRKRGRGVATVARAERAVAAPQAVHRSRREARERLTFLAFVIPNLCLLGLFSYWPLVQNAYLSFVEWDMISPEKLWVGLDNWHLVLTDRNFQRILLNTFVFTTGSVGATLALGLLVALLLNQRLAFRNGARTVL